MPCVCIGSIDHKHIRKAGGLHAKIGMCAISPVLGNTFSAFADHIDAFEKRVGIKAGSENESIVFTSFFGVFACARYSDASALNFFDRVGNQFHMGLIERF